MKDCNCGYCMGGEILAGFGIKICDLQVSQLILFKEQSHPGRVIVAYKDHVSELVNISDEERNLFFADVAKAANAIHQAFHPDKVNYGAYGDGGCHLHFHLVPKYAGDFEWGMPFAMNPGKTYLTEEEYAAMIENIKKYLSIRQQRPVWALLSVIGHHLRILLKYIMRTQRLWRPRGAKNRAHRKVCPAFFRKLCNRNYISKGSMPRTG